MLKFQHIAKRPKTTGQQLAKIYDIASSYQLQSKKTRYLPQVADKVLDAPDLIDDFYLNLVDWGNNNVVSVCLGTSLYLWNANTSSICELLGACGGI